MKKKERRSWPSAGCPPASWAGQVEVAWTTRRILAYEWVVYTKIQAWLACRGGGTVSVLMTDTPRLEALNRKYRGVFKPTAVMAFPQFRDQRSAIRGPRVRADGRPERLWGDVVIAVDAVRRYARLEGVKPEAILSESEFVDHGLSALGRSR